ncbi:hypothetical protein [Bacillus sp. AG4(2022)]|uniref:hypothetical protein n=1 Tax=Bacillus sp. AG4(2022) TaxID=2962594 RepID=UPI002882157A|nr:hypothetical protein [Bacillus sp. AG4(2022)]MDT0163830.1 hypothetical protein [Bacillus sp. AG4(2022)]
MKTYDIIFRSGKKIQKSGTLVFFNDESDTVQHVNDGIFLNASEVVAVFEVKADKNPDYIINETPIFVDGAGIGFEIPEKNIH